MRETGTSSATAANYNDPDALIATLNRARDGEGRSAWPSAWFHPGPAAHADDAHRGRGRAGRFFHVLGSAAADPDYPGRLAQAAATAKDAAYCAYRQVLLGFLLEDAGARWLTNAEISAGVLKAIDDDAPFTALGVTEPWALRPSR